jgi:hypothetical protein
MAMANQISEIKSSNFGHDCHLARQGSGGSMLFVNGKLTYYITDTIWQSLCDMAEVAPNTLFVQGYTELLQEVIAGSVMTFSQVLDCLILENHVIGILDNYWLLPTDLSVSEETLLKFINGAGLFLQTKQVY